MEHSQWLAHPLTEAFLFKLRKRACDDLPRLLISAHDARAGMETVTPLLAELKINTTLLKELESGSFIVEPQQ